MLHYGDLCPALTELLDTRALQYANREAVVEIGGPRFTIGNCGSPRRASPAGSTRAVSGTAIAVGIGLPNGARWVQAFFGALLSGALPVPVNDRGSSDDRAHVLADSAVDVVLDEDLPDATGFIDDGASLGEVALLCYTNGTHGRRGPKASS